MTYMDYVRLLADLAFIQVVESTFIILMVMMFGKLELNKHNIILTVGIVSIAGVFLLPFGNYDIYNRIVYLVVLWVTICLINKCSLERSIKILVNLISVLIIMMVIEFIGVVPLLFFLGEDISGIHGDVFLMLAFTIPTRLLEYLVCYLTYLRLGGKNEEIN